MMMVFGKTIVSVSFVFLLFISYSVLIGTIDIKSNFFPLIQHSRSPSLCKDKYDQQQPLRVFMYDLPPRFNVAMLNRHTSNNHTPLTLKDLPPWPSSSGLKKQHSVEYWMMASLFYHQHPDANQEAVRVSDPDTADVFFVPFFSSLSFNTHGHTMTDPDTEIDRRLQEDILKFLRESNYWQRSEGRDHVIPIHHPNAFRFLREQLNASILIVADFGRYPKTMSNLRKDVVAPYVHVVDSFMDDNNLTVDPFESRPTLLFFRGRTVRKDEGKVRAKLENVLAGYDDVHYEQSYASDESIKASSKGMRTSKFCLNPAGDTPSSCRLFDAIVSHCVPVIVSDRIELPFEDEIDYTQLSIFFSIKEALEPGFVVKELRQISKEKWVHMWSKLKNVSHHFEYQNPPKNEDAVNMIWRQLPRGDINVATCFHVNNNLLVKTKPY